MDHILNLPANLREIIPQITMQLVVVIPKPLPIYQRQILGLGSSCSCADISDSFRLLQKFMVSYDLGELVPSSKQVMPWVTEVLFRYSEFCAQMNESS